MNVGNGFIKGQWYICRCNQCYYRCYNVNNRRFIYDAVINPTESEINNNKKGYTKRSDWGCIENYNADKLAPLDIISNYIKIEKLIYECW